MKEEIPTSFLVYFYFFKILWPLLRKGVSFGTTETTCWWQQGASFVSSPIPLRPLDEPGDRDWAAAEVNFTRWDLGFHWQICCSPVSPLGNYNTFQLCTFHIFQVWELRTDNNYPHSLSRPLFHTAWPGSGHCGEDVNKWSCPLGGHCFIGDLWKQDGSKVPEGWPLNWIGLSK